MSKRKKIELTDDYVSELKDLGRAIRYARRESGMSLRDLSTVCGVMHYQISNIENGKIGTTTHTLHRILSALDTTIREVYENLELIES